METLKSGFRIFGLLFIFLIVVILSSIGLQWNGGMSNSDIVFIQTESIQSIIAWQIITPSPLIGSIEANIYNRYQSTTVMKITLAAYTRQVLPYLRC